MFAFRIHQQLVEIHQFKLWDEAEYVGLSTQLSITLLCFLALGPS